MRCNSTDRYSGVTLWVDGDITGACGDCLNANISSILSFYLYKQIKRTDYFFSFTLVVYVNDFPWTSFWQETSTMCTCGTFHQLQSASHFSIRASVQMWVCAIIDLVEYIPRIVMYLQCPTNRMIDICQNAFAMKN